MKTCMFDLYSLTLTLRNISCLKVRLLDVTCIRALLFVFKNFKINHQEIIATSIKSCNVDRTEAN